MPLAIEPQAQAFYNILEAIFDHADANLEPKGLGLWTTERAMMVMKDTGQLDTLEVYKIIPASVLIEQYKIMGCAMYLVPTYDPSASPFDFREPDQPGITKAGWIKSEVISMLLKNNETQYNALQYYINKYDLRITDPADKARFPGGRYMALPEKSTVEWYARSLGKALGLGNIEEMNKRMQASLEVWVESLRPKQTPGPEPSPEQNGMAEEQFIAQRNRMLSDEREIKLLAMATRMAGDQTRRNMESMDRMNGITRVKYTTYDF